MAQTIADALLKAGIVQPHQTPKGVRTLRMLTEATLLEEKKRQAQLYFATLRTPPVQVPNVAHVIVQQLKIRVVHCKQCGVEFQALRGMTIREVCDDCAPPETVQRVRGEMVWAHKTAPMLAIEGKPGPTPEEMAAGRRR